MQPVLHHNVLHQVLEDWKIHQEVCDQDQVERKKKLGVEARREESREAREVFKEHFSENVGMKAACEMMENVGFGKRKRRLESKL